MLTFILVLSSLNFAVHGFSFMGSVRFLFNVLLLFTMNMIQWKLPSIESLQKAMTPNKFGNKRLCVITGTSSGLGKQTAKHLLKTGQW